MTTLHTPRLTLRPITADDTAALVAMFSDPELGRHHAGDLTDPDEIVALVRRRLDYRGPDGTGDWIFERDGEMVGIGHLRTSTELPGGVLECGWHLARAHWGSGFAEEAARAIVGHAHHTLGAPAVFALVHEQNPRGRRFVERLGFVAVGSGDHYGAVHDVLVSLPEPGGVHHVELWVSDLASAEKSLGWLLTELGWREYQRWPRGVSWRYGASYVVVEDSPDRRGDRHERTRPGLNHLALHVPTGEDLDRIVAAAPEHGWRLMFADKHPHAGGPKHLAGYLENDDGFELELVVAQLTL
ncbi:MAG: GNAT family N-acetyltransferase [Actinophytocola sp.]|uniref:GNAT family N-acetyltransferase n=1 Tax=Actinophytocola sp. TaxID=1872138 RepID=UPI00132139C3|nr:GNAT family N-acetyltransferase [Actinophytocola sp.]MPZ82249.1 GNAT family N-acetyltransferase [Actinophytocola sp.]